MIRRRLTAVALLLGFVLSSVAPAAGQDAGAGTGGAIQRAQEARLAGTWRRVLMIGAHPDDEDTELLTILTRGRGIETAYLSLTRGEGGQNLIGSELGRALGVLRTEELLAARSLDGGRQFFTRAYDFGFSKSAEETFRFWPHDSLIKDAVRIIRRFRPQVVVGVWSGTTRDGHGHHQVAGIVAREAFDAAGDPARYPELQREEGLAPWTPAKFYRSGRMDAAAPAEGLDGGVIDPAEGQSMHQIAARSRSRHRSQDMGQLEDLGPSRVRVILEATAPGIVANGDSLFAGIAPSAPLPNDPHRAVVALADAGVILDATTDDDEVVRGQELTVTVSVWNGGPRPVQADVSPLRQDGWTMRSEGCVGALGVIAPGELKKCKYQVTVWDNAPPSTPYFLRNGLEVAMYRWGKDASLLGEPFEPPPVRARFTVTTADGEAVTTVREVQARSLDQGLGEVRRPIQVVPRIAVDLSPDKLLWPVGVRARTFRVSLEHLAKDSSLAEVTLVVPPGWTAPKPQRVVLRREGERAAADFVVGVPAQAPPGDYEIAASVAVGPDTLSLGVYRIRYPHVPPRNIVTRAMSIVVLAPVTLPRARKIGYVRGAADRVPEALLNTGVPVRLLTGDALERAPLDSFSVIVIGARAYEVDASLQRAHPRLMSWLERGGTLVVQYQQYPFIRGGFAPLPFTIASPHDRVTDEDAPVKLLAPTSPLLRSPNRIGQADFTGWVQERGLYFARSWDRTWTPLLEMHDSGDVAREGSLLVGRRGRGTVIYTGIAFFRELPAAVPGAWRLFMNLLDAGAPRAGRQP
ncbi:MAG: PIG-L family deacetylase [Gemmatimonadales bacterium]|nr:PIG-L family deacetylase [Gemmatimonadales bacterium]